MNATKRNPDNALVDSVVGILNQGETLLMEISDDVYTRKLPVAFNASIGAHYRHCLDHFQNLHGAAVTGDLNYDARQRDPLLENDRFAALNATRALREQYLSLDGRCLVRALNVTCKTNYSTGDSQISASTVGREVMYVVAHAVHHYALIGIMGALMEVKMPAGFGVAPSTLKYQANTAKTGTR